MCELQGSFSCRPWQVSQRCHFQATGTALPSDPCPAACSASIIDYDSMPIWDRTISFPRRTADGAMQVIHGDFEVRGDGNVKDRLAYSAADRLEESQIGG
jgi:hypothetical protein